MRSSYLLAVLLAASVSFSHAESIRLSMESEGDRVIYYELPRETIISVPFWDVGSEIRPPLTRDEAVEIAKREAQKAGVVDLKETGLSVSLMKLDAKRVALPTGCCRWFYRVDLEPKPRTGKTRFVIVMNGIVAIPVADLKND